MLTARINLNGTQEGDLLLSTLVKKASSYIIIINYENENIAIGESFFSIEIENEEEPIFVSISPKTHTFGPENVRIDIYRDGGNKIVATIDEPFVVSPDSIRQRLIMEKDDSGLNWKKHVIDAAAAAAAAATATAKAAAASAAAAGTAEAFDAATKAKAAAVVAAKAAAKAKAAASAAETATDEEVRAKATAATAVAARAAATKAAKAAAAAAVEHVD